MDSQKTKLLYFKFSTSQLCVQSPFITTNIESICNVSFIAVDFKALFPFVLEQHSCFLRCNVMLGCVIHKSHDLGH